ncbi:MAG: hypothetical protein MJY87_00550 [Fibrobacter sp.]|nr:hypothetical protein [Fibrobacter sp.]
MEFLVIWIGYCILAAVVGLLIVKLFKYFFKKNTTECDDFDACIMPNGVVSNASTIEDPSSTTVEECVDPQQKQNDRANNIVLTLCTKIAFCDKGNTNLKLDIVREIFADTSNLANKIIMIQSHLDEIDIVQCAKDAVDVYDNSNAYLTIIRYMYRIAMSDGISAEEEMSICEVAETMNIRPSVQEAIKNEYK